MDITTLHHTLNTWVRRLRVQRGITWAVRGMIAGLAFALLIGGVGLYQAKLVRAEFLALIAGSASITPLLFGLTATLWRISALQAARHFDVILHLNERLSTALELNQRPEHVPPEIVNRQLADALAASQTADVRTAIPLRVNGREGLAVLVCAALLAVIWFRGDALFNASQQAQNVEQAVQEQTEAIEKLIEQIESSNALTEEQKEALTQPLKEAQQSLQSDPSLENSVAVLTTTGQKLQEVSNPQAEEMAQSLKDAGNQLANQDGSPLESVGEKLADGDTIGAATELANTDVSELTPGEQAELANQLEQMADSLASSNPQLAEQLNQAAQALQNGDTEAAQQALNQAAKSLAQAGQQVASSQTASQAADQLQEGAGQVLAAGGNAAQANQPGQGTNQSNQSSGNSGTGSGAGNEAGSNQGSGNEAGNDPIAQNNGAGDGGETSYEQIYAPQLLGGEGGPQVNLPPGGGEGGEVIGQGPVTPGDPGTSTVPYNEVFSQYEQANNEAIENGDVPVSFIQIIKDYFDSLTP